MNIETLTHEEIVRELEKLHELEVGSDQHRAGVEATAKLIDRAIEMERLSVESEDKLKSREFEHEMKLKQARDERIDRIVKNCLTGVSIIGGFGLTVWGSLKSWKFEETGTITSGPGRKFMSALFFKK